MAKDQDFSYEQLNLFGLCGGQQEAESPGSLSGKTCREHFPAIEDWILRPCLKKSQKKIFQYLRMPPPKVDKSRHGAMPQV